MPILIFELLDCHFMEKQLIAVELHVGRYIIIQVYTKKAVLDFKPAL